MYNISTKYLDARVTRLMKAAVPQSEQFINFMGL